jgi:hypothetical protein
MHNVLIVGDSFGADWTIKYNTHGLGWPNIIENKFNVTNISQAGCSEYKILLQLRSVTLSDYHIVVVNHTSPFRLYVKTHPVHADDVLHHSSDLLYNDILFHYKQHPTDDLSVAIGYFEKYFDLDYANYMYKLIYNDIIETCSVIKSLQVVHTESIIDDKNLLRLAQYSKHNKGLLNHYNKTANIEVACIVTHHILKIINQKLS